MAASHHNIPSLPPPSTSFNGSAGFMPTSRRKMMMHMTFFWDHIAKRDDGAMVGCREMMVRWLIFGDRD
ncbi:hypothetical protein L3X38_026213 [Prunus dulcis]|uniref:Uncharacterized protein n=1 Tax=Prunus dulcis TaxID=3755 RepID=A0AAD4W4S4_PRUDU|nr:hypothetical protein L3X38_026213 [Prunus dulcis]